MWRYYSITLLAERTYRAQRTITVYAPDLMAAFDLARKEFCAPKASVRCEGSTTEAPADPAPAGAI